MEQTDFIFTERMLARLDEIQRSDFFVTLKTKVPDLLLLISWTLGGTLKDRNGVVLQKHGPAYAFTPTGRAGIQTHTPHDIVTTGIGDIGLWPAPDVEPGKRYVIDLAEGVISIRPAHGWRGQMVDHPDVKSAHVDTQRALVVDTDLELRPGQSGYDAHRVQLLRDAVRDFVANNKNTIENVMLRSWGAPPAQAD